MNGTGDAGTDVVDLDHDLPAEGLLRTDAHDDSIVARPITEVLDRSLDHGGSIGGHTAVQFDDRPWLIDEVIEGVGDRRVWSRRRARRVPARPPR